MTTPTPKQRLIEAVRGMESDIGRTIPRDEFDNSYLDGQEFVIKKFLKLIEEILP